MKKSVFVLSIILCSNLLFVGCGGNETENNTSTTESEAKKKEADALAKKQEEEKLAKQKQDSINQALSAIKVKIYNHEPLAFDSEGWCLMPDNSVKISEVKNFNETKTYKCKQGNYIQKLTIEGDFNGINIQFLDAKDKLIKEFKNYDLKKSVSYSDVNYQPVSQQQVEKKDKDYQKWFAKASKIQMTYNDSIFYSANWKNNGWYIQ
jgi:hypothetical protein